MKTNVKTIWGNGFVSVADKYINKAIEKKESLTIVHSKSKAKMVLSLEELKGLKPRKTIYNDKYGNGTYRLFDIFWKSNND
jgi:hypothetical protein